MSGRGVFVTIALVVGVACVLGGIVVIKTVTGGALFWMLAVSLFLAGALIISVTLAYAVTRPAPGEREAPRRPAEPPRAYALKKSSPSADDAPPLTNDDPPWVRGLANRDQSDDGGEPRG